jgi:NAD(P)H-hydrate epimerase
VALRPDPFRRRPLKPLVAAAEAADLDRRIRDEVGVPEAALMENAAAGMQAALESRRLAAGTVTALVGKGNNGGDASAVLRRLAFESAGRPGPELRIILSSGEPEGLAGQQLKAARACGIAVLSWESDEAACRDILSRSSLILDGIAGTGLSGPLRPREAALVETVASRGAVVAAVDVPSGCGDGIPPDSPVLRADLTLCVEPLKACLFRPGVRPLAGEIVPVPGVFPRDSGSESPIRLLEPGDLSALVPPLRPEAHKYERGHCRVFAGDVGTSGAAVLAARGAAAGGAGLVTLHVRPEIWQAAASALAGEIVRPLPPDPSDLDLGRTRAAVAGPGWGRDGIAAAVLRRLWDSGFPLVLDADALALLGDLDLPARLYPLVLTPHPGEAERLSGRPAAEFLGSPEKVLPDLCRRWNAVVVLKSCVTWISSPDGRTAVYDGMDGSLAVGGSGDVLAGLCGALLSRGMMTPFEAAKAAVLAHGSAGASARAALGHYGADALPGFAAKVLGGLHDQ